MAKKRMKDPQKLEETTKSWRCFICSTENDLKTFETDSDLLFHHMTHSILELAQTLTEIQNILKTADLFDIFPLNKKSPDIKETEDGFEPLEEPLVDDFEVFEKPEKPKKMSKNKTHKCKICCKILSSKGNLNKHMIIHDPSKQFECSECQAKFNQVRLQNL